MIDIAFKDVAFCGKRRKRIALVKLTCGRCVADNERGIDAVIERDLNRCKIPELYVIAVDRAVGIAVNAYIGNLRELGV